MADFTTESHNTSSLKQPLQDMDLLNNLTSFESLNSNEQQHHMASQLQNHHHVSASASFPNLHMNFDHDLSISIDPNVQVYDQVAHLFPPLAAGGGVSSSHVAANNMSKASNESEYMIHSSSSSVSGKLFSAGANKKNGSDQNLSGKKRKRNSERKPEKPSEVIHVRAKRGQATDSHSLAERLRREKINEKFRCLQDLVPGCYKTMGMAVMLDVIINYVRSLQNQIDFLSMKLSAASLFHDFNSPDHVDAMGGMQGMMNAAYEANNTNGMERMQGGAGYGGFPLQTSWPL